MSGRQEAGMDLSGIQKNRTDLAGRQEAGMDLEKNVCLISEAGEEGVKREGRQRTLEMKEGGVRDREEEGKAGDREEGGGEEEMQAYLGQLQGLGCILGLENMRNLMAELGDVQDRLPIVHVAGTNGKGSVCAMLSSVLQEAGYRVGMYTSPAVFGEREQYQINGVAISEEKWQEILGEVKYACESVIASGMPQPTAFEVETAMAFLYFWREGCQVAVIETGLGGEEDATNIIKKPLLSILTSISRDHMQFLGDSLAGIARKKAGIIKEGGIAVAAEPQEQEVRQAIEEICQERHVRLIYASEEEASEVHIRQEGYARPADAREEEAEDAYLGQGRLCFSYGALGRISLSMAGAYQAANAICVIKAVEALREVGWAIPAAAIKAGLERAQWEGRFSILCRKPLFVMDGAHNQGAAEKLRETLKMGFTNRKIIYIIGVLADKEHEKILKTMLPLAWKVFTVTPFSPRALDGRKLAEEARKYHQDVTFCHEIRGAVRQSLWLAAEEKAMVLAFGSLSYLGEIRKALEENIL
ncbi:MAG: bifunctional folylpolyglutamate synthase/dihydrofolate synthase [Lachnospiraceae bacterium]|nr:bifunctional folylpolyglutamate synthase/dihydrofolate synthase [Lachnospiraceae bacterium]